MRSILTLLIVFFLLPNNVLAAGKKDKLECKTKIEGREAELKLEGAGSNVKFKAKTEIDVGQGNVEGDNVSVSINGTIVVQLILDADGKKELEGKAEFKGALPVGFPVIQAGTPATVGGLACVFVEK